MTCAFRAREEIYVFEGGIGMMEYFQTWLKGEGGGRIEKGVYLGRVFNHRAADPATPLFITRTPPFDTRTPLLLKLFGHPPLGTLNFHLPLGLSYLPRDLLIYLQHLPLI